MDDEIETIEARVARVDDDIAREPRRTVRSLAEQADRTDESTASSSYLLSDQSDQ